MATEGIRLATMLIDVLERYIHLEELRARHELRKADKEVCKCVHECANAQGSNFNQGCHDPHASQEGEPQKYIIGTYGISGGESIL